MNKRFTHGFYSLIIFVVSGLLGVTGCQQFGSSDYYSIDVPTQNLGQIEPLELERAEQQDSSILDSNEPIGEELELTLEQCRALTLENNLELKIQLIAPTIAAERVNQQETQFEAAFTANASFSKTDTPTSTTLSGSQGENSNVNLGVQVPLRTGGTVNFDIADSRSKTDNVFSTLNPSYRSDFTASISQPLLRNAGRRISTYSIQIAKYDQKITDARTQLEVTRVIAAVDRVYWRLYAAMRELDVRQQQYDLAVALFEQAQRFVDAGERAQVEVTRTEAGVAQQLESIIVSENSIRDRERELKRTINETGLEMITRTVLIPTTEPDPVLYDLDKERLINIAIEQRMEMLELELQIAQDILNLDYLDNQALPLVTLDYSYNVSGLGSTWNNSFDLLFEKRFEDHRIGLQLVMPLGNESANSQLRQAFYQRRQNLASRDDRKNLIEYEVLNAVDQVEANWQRILASRQSAILEGRLYETELRQFELGLVTATDVLQAQANFADAQTAEISALVGYQISLIDLAYATGTLLGAAKVTWEPIVPEN
ncbi:TolC family protein [Planctomycetota bacterium]